MLASSNFSFTVDEVKHAGLLLKVMLNYSSCVTKLIKEKPLINAGFEYFNPIELVKAKCFELKIFTVKCNQL